MTLAEFSLLVDASPKWVLNALKAFERRPSYTVSFARRLAVTRAIHANLGLPLFEAFAFARPALRDFGIGPSPVVLLRAPDDVVGLTVDMHRILSAFNIRLATVRESYAPAMRGRPTVRPVNALDAAETWGLDLSLIKDNLRKTPGERLRQLDAMVSFAQNVRRTGVPGTSDHV